jgi:DNA repair protein RecN (Recombination protein N)
MFFMCAFMAKKLICLQMLKKLSIQNYAIIDELEIDFSGKLNIITGETGAGKSIIMGALNLILGERADTAALVSKEKKCVIEGMFNVGSKKNVKEFLLVNELDAEEEQGLSLMILP